MDPTPAPQAAAAARPGVASAQPQVVVDVLLYDGVCALCNGLVRFLLARDRERRIRYASLQSDFAREALARHGESPASLSTVFLLERYGRPDERCRRRSRAALAVIRRVGGGWALAARAISLLPTPLLDLGYVSIAKVRYLVFGRYAACPLPAPEHRDLFVDFAAGSSPGTAAGSSP